MRIGICDGRSFGDGHFQKLKSFGFDCYDFKMVDTDAVPYTCGDREFEAYLKNEKRRADEAGIRIWQVHGPWRYPPEDETPENRAERLEKMKRSLHGAAILGAAYWVVHPLMPVGLQDVTENQVQQTRACNLSFMTELLACAKQEGVTVCLENMPFRDFSLSSPEAIADFVREVDDPSFAMCLDTGHANVCETWDTPADAIRKYARYVKVLHVHDNMGRDEHLLPFSGTVDWMDFSAALRETAFPGVLSLECAPSRKLPDDLYEDMYALYARTARAICDLSR